MSKECKCTNPDGGGTKCPVQHVAVCIRGKDKECYGECVPIPNRYNTVSYTFNQWLSDKVEEIVIEYARENYSDNMKFSPLRKISQSDFLEGGRMTFQISDLIRIYVQFAYEFNDIEPLAGQSQPANA